MRILCGFLLFTALAFSQASPGFDPSAIDRNANPCVDFYRYACGAWMAANPIPADQSRWGRFDALQDRNRDILRKILDDAAVPKAGRSPIEQKIGDYYASCTNEAAVEAKGASPLKPDLDRIAAIKSKADITGVVAYLARSGATPFFHFSSGPDAKNSAQVIADLDQGGLGLPDRDYYSKTDAKSVEIREQYVSHMRKMLELAGAKPEDAARQAQAVMALETELAKASLDRVARRDPTNLYHKVAVTELGSEFAWPKFFTEVGAPRFRELNVDVPAFIKAVNALIASTSLDDLKTYLTGIWCMIRRQALPLALPAGIVQFLRQDAARRQGNAPALEALRGSDRPAVAGRAGPNVRRQNAWAKRACGARSEMVAEIEKAMETDIQSVDWMTPKTKEQALVKLHAVTNKIGNKAHWLDYSSVKVAARRRLRQQRARQRLRDGSASLARSASRWTRPIGT